MQILIALLAVGVLMVMGWANYRFAQLVPGGNDFLARWTGARAWVVEGRSPYDPEVSLTAQRMIYGRPAKPEAGEDLAHFVYPLPAMVFFAPFGLLPYSLARAAWMTLLEIALPATALLSIRLAHWRPRMWQTAVLLLFSVAWYHAVRGVIVGQFAVLEAALIAGALWAVDRKADLAAGVLLGLSIAKPQMVVLLIPFVLIWAWRARRGRLILSLLGTVAVLVGGALWLQPDWPLRWLQQVATYPEYTRTGSPVSILGGLLPRGGEYLTWGLTGILLIYLLFEWARAAGREGLVFQWAAAMTLVITNLVVIRTATTHFVVLLPAFVLAFHAWEERWRSAGRLLSNVCLAALLLGPWALFLATVEGNIESPVMYLPVPLTAWVALLWVRWWVEYRTKLPVDEVPISA